MRHFVCLFLWMFGSLKFNCMTVVTAQQTQTHRQRLCGQNEKFFNGKTEHAVSTAPCKFSHKYVANLKICSVQSDVSVGHFFCDVLVLTLWDRAETHDEAWRWSALLVVRPRVPSFWRLALWRENIVVGRLCQCRRMSDRELLCGGFCGTLSSFCFGWNGANSGYSAFLCLRPA